MTYHILVTDDIDPEGVALLTAEPSFEVDELPTLPPAQLLERIGRYDAIVGRSATRITDELLRKAVKLRVVGRAPRDSPRGRRMRCPLRDPRAH